MARAKKESRAISLRMDKSVYDKLTDFCDYSGQSKTVAVERAVAEYVERHQSQRDEHDTPVA